MSKNKTNDTNLLIGDNIIDFDDLTKSQKTADHIFKTWYLSKSKKNTPILRIGGAAGSGKTYFIQYLINAYELDLSNTMIMSYTGQAVNVLRRHGVMAKTIHSSVMRAIEEPLMKDGEVVTKRNIPIVVTRFRPIKKLPSEVKLLIIDEASFLSEELEKILLRYNIPILEIGDPFQLSPVAGKQCFTMEKLDYFIEGVLRQGKDSEILELATAIRKGEKLETWRFRNEVLFLKAKPTLEDTFMQYRSFIKGSDVVITSTNKQRQTINDMYREVILKTDNPYPRKNERLICRQNDWNLMLGPYPLTNGTQGYAVGPVGRSMVDKSAHGFYLDFQPDYIDNDYFDNLFCDSDFLKSPVGADKINDKFNPGKKFEYAYAITAHLSQGAQYPKVMFFDSYNRDQEYRMKVVYTSATRAERKLFYVIPYSKNYPGWFDLRASRRVS